MREEFKEDLLAAGVNLPDAVERCCGKEELFERLLKIYFKNPNEMTELAEKAEGKHYEELFSQAHALKGAAGGIGLTKLYQSLCKLVESLRSADYELIDEEAQEVINSFNTIGNIVQRYSNE